MIPFSANISILFTEVPFHARFPLAASAGFKAVECWFPYEHEAGFLHDTLETCGLRLIGINTPPGDTTKGEFGFAALPGREADFDASFGHALEYAVALDCPNIHVLAGRPESSDDLALAEATFIENVTRAAALAGESQKTLLIEPLNPIDRPGYFLSRQAQASALIDCIGAPNVKIMFDVYHVQMTEGNIVARLREHIAKIGHIQIADVPGRGEPGTGEINFPFVMNAIRDAGYEGWIGCEYKPRTTTFEGLAWRKRYAA